MTIRKILARGLGLALALVAGASPVDAAERGALKIGFLAPLTGGFAGQGKDMLAGFEIYLEEVGYALPGRKIELIVEDTEGAPAPALTKARKLLEKDGVHVLAGGLLASTGYALAPYVAAQRIPTLFPLIASDDLTQRKPTRWVIRTGWTSSQTTHPFGEYAGKVLGYTKVAGVASDYALGWEMLGGFQRVFEDSGGQLVQRIWTPLNASDFGPYLAQLRKDVDAVFAVQGGSRALQFVKQYREFGLKGKIPLLGAGVLTTDGLQGMGDDALGIITPLPFAEALESPASRRFREAFEKKTGRVVTYQGAFAYTGARWIAEAAKAIGGAVEDRERFLAALRAVEVADDPRGPLKLDPDGNPIENVYIRKVERVGGRLQNTVIYTYPHVSQYWTYPREDFLRQPVYERNFPPCRYC